jgi:hypothetical protein
MRRLLRRQVPNMNAVPSQRPALRHPGLLDALREAPEPYFVETHRLRRTSVSAPPLHLCGRTQRPCLACPLIEKNDIPRFRRVSFDRRRETLIHPGIRAEGDSSTSGRSWQERGAATATIRFEELVADPVASVSDAGAELNLDLLEGTGDLHSFEDRRALLPANFRLGKSRLMARRDARLPRGAILVVSRVCDGAVGLSPLATDRPPLPIVAALVARADEELTPPLLEDALQRLVEMALPVPWETLAEM